MLAILWLIVWATVGDAFYDDYNWYTSDDGVTYRGVELQKAIRGNFSDTLRSFADSYIPQREGDEELTLSKVKSRLRMMKVFTHTGDSKDFEPRKGKVLPLYEGGRFCTMGRHTKVDCNHCTCVAGQLYICTGMICPKAPAKPQPLITCLEGKRRKIDSCNYCYCRNGHEICSTRDCRLQHDHLLVRSRYTCHEGARRKVACNRCICRNGEQYCTKKKCSTEKPTQLKLKLDSQLPEGRCNDGESLKMDCRVCKCTQNHWRCSDKNCYVKRKPEKLLWAKCKEGTTRQLDACNTCYCRFGREICEKKVCDEEHLPPAPAPGPDPAPDRALRMTNSQDDYDDLPKKCKIGERYRIDSCNYCYCNAYHERVCSNNKCTTPQLLQGDDRFPLNVSEQQCKIGSSFRKGDCNYCYCNYDGHLVCSRNQCTRKLSSGLSDEKEILRFTPAPKICFPDERFRFDNCNWCYCTGDRKRVCEKNLPCNRTVPDNRWPPNQPRKGCYIGSRFEWGKCGYCYCTVWRKIECLPRYNCTEDVTTTTHKPKINVSEQITKPRNSLNFECEVGEIERIDDCNFCHCTFSRKWMCSDNVCPSNYDHHNFLLSKTNLCTDGVRRQVDACNYCVCHSGAEFCTQKPCWRDTVPKIYSEPECVVGDPVPAPDPCNQCICLDSEILCTDNPCIQRQAANSIELNKFRCKFDGQKYRMNDGCNFCICQGGQEFCTSRACLVHDAISESLLSYIRTQKIKKHKMTQGTKRRCSPGQKYFPDDFDPNCPNDCICDRHELLCTKRKCFNNWDKQTPFTWPLGRVKKKTKNVKQYLKQDCDEYQKLPSGDPCNSCMCLNGRKVCTIVNCSDDDGESGAIEALFNNYPRGSKGNKAKMKKKKNTFCEPFTFFSPDNNRFCRNCFCLHNGLALCLLNLCKYSQDIPHQNSLEELDEVCTPGEIGYPTKCVTCTCSVQGKWICTREELALCQERDCDEKDEFHMGFLPYCAGCKCAVKEWFCSIQSETCSDYSNASCPLGSFIRNPRQHCSICLCGGYEEGSHNMCFTEAKCARQVNSQLKR